MCRRSNDSAAAGGEWDDNSTSVVDVLLWRFSPLEAQLV